MAFDINEYIKGFPEGTDPERITVLLDGFKEMADKVATAEDRASSLTAQYDKLKGEYVSRFLSGEPPKPADPKQPEDDKVLRFEDLFK